MRLDFGGIGKGCGADRGLERLRARGFEHALVGIEGDLALGAPPPGEHGWRVAAGASASELDETLLLANCGVSTSGDAAQAIEVDGARSAHVIDPRTGLGLATHVRTTVIARDATHADALATALTLLGPERGVEIVERVPGVQARVVERDGNARMQRETTGYRRIVVERSAPSNGP
jgi:thiamine biosynthesis lipoprotein